MITYTNEDCLAGMARYPDKHFDLAIVDPPYGIGAEAGFGKWGSLKFRQTDKKWDNGTPDHNYFLELSRVSKVQIVWGGNYFNLPPSRCFIVWDKGAGMRGRTYAEAEQAWCSLDANSKIFTYDALANGDYKGRIHPTQKPVALYKWLLKNYAKQGDKILDTHVGSASSLIACYDMGFDAVGFELDADYYKASKERLEDFMRQPRLDDLSPEQWEQVTL